MGNNGTSYIRLSLAVKAMFEQYVSKHKPNFPELALLNFPIIVIIHISLGLNLKPLENINANMTKMKEITSENLFPRRSVKQKYLNVIRRR
jgi:hypothetical protein